jgi:DNA-binding response OmpR family regulator
VVLPAAVGKAVREQAGKQPHAIPAANQRELGIGTARRKPGAAQHVLVVEDEPTVAQLIADVLSDEGFLVEVLLDGRDAMERVAQKSFDLVICDMKMPNLDGQSFFRGLSQSKHGLQEKFLFVTGDVLGAKTHEFLEKHKLPHVAKPFQVEELLEKVHHVLRTAPSSGMSRAAAANSNSAKVG